jgi:putative tributyrin esterase
MIFLQMNVKSKSLARIVALNLLLPQNPKGEYKTLWLLHGCTDDHTAWMRYSSIERYAEERGIAVVMPNADRSWYTDTVYGAKYFEFISSELPEILHSHFKGMSEKREDNIIAGLSMGGYGAMKFALAKPEQYGACISLSGALDITRKNRTCRLNEWQSIFDYQMVSPDELEGSEHDLFVLAENAVKNGVSLPKLYMWCGTEDVLIGNNDSFHAHLEALGVNHTYERSQGEHKWKWWDMHIQSGLDCILG